MTQSRYASKPVFDDAEQRARTQEAVRLYPKRAGEGVTAYLERICKEAELLAEDAREPGEEG